jgi:hypothetical protein
VPQEQVLDRAIERGGAHGWGIDRLCKAHPQYCVRPGVDHQPAFLLALLAKPEFLCLRVAGMDLHRQFLAGEDILDQQLRQVLRRLEPDLADPFARRIGEWRG